jgi:hypothetical protein
MFRIYRYEEDEELNNDDLSDFNFDENAGDRNEEDGAQEMETPNEEPSLGDENQDLEGETETEEDPDFAGTIRTVVGAALVFKRKEKSNTFEELWIYNADNDLKKITQIRNSILAGTDIDPHTERSEDGEQTCDTTTVGNVQYLHIRGLPN